MRFISCSIDERNNVLLRNHCMYPVALLNEYSDHQKIKDEQ